MNELIHVTNEHGQAVVSSREVARRFGKEHKHVLDSIKNLVAENSAAKSMFHSTTYENRGRPYPEYLMNRDGFALLAMGFTGKEALAWKLKYIQAFNDMEKEIQAEMICAAIPPMDARMIEAQARLMDKRNEAARLWMAMADRACLQYTKEDCMTCAATALAGGEVKDITNGGRHRLWLKV